MEMDGRYLGDFLGYCSHCRNLSDWFSGRMVSCVRGEYGTSKQYGALLLKTDYIKYVEFNVTYPALEKALNLDVEAHNQGKTKNWVELLAYLGAKYGGDFSKYKNKDLEELSAKLDEGATMEELTE